MGGVLQHVWRKPNSIDVPCSLLIKRPAGLSRDWPVLFLHLKLSPLSRHTLWLCLSPPRNAVYPSVRLPVSQAPGKAETLIQVHVCFGLQTTSASCSVMHMNTAYAATNIMRLCLVSLACLVLGIAGPVSAAGTQGYIVKRDVPYLQPVNLAQSGDFYLPKSSGLRPAVVLIHGGGWSAGSNHDGAVSFLAPQMAARGWVVFNINYRLVKQGGVFPNDLEDVKDALAWLTLHATRYRINKSKMVLVGLSAGAHLSLMAAYTIKAGRFPAVHYPAVPLHVAAAVGFYTPTYASYFTSLPKTSWVYQTIAAYIDPWLRKHPHSGLKTAAPLLYAPDAVPTLLLLGSGDHLVPPAQTYAMAAALKKASVPVKVVVVPGVGHGFMSWKCPARAAGWQALKAYLHQINAPGNTTGVGRSLHAKLITHP